MTLKQMTPGRDDCTRELLEWGTKVAAANPRPPSRIG
jgi:hypothetical protein